MRLSLLAFTLIILGTATVTTFGQEIVSHSPSNTCSMEQLVRMTKCQLLALYSNGAAGPIPHGFMNGRMIQNPGRLLTPARATLVNKTIWQGKIFLDDEHMINKAFGKEVVPGAVYVAESWYDGKPSIIIDYTGSWWYAARFRDEFREIAPGTYLGLTYERKCCPELRVFFALEAACGCK